MLTAKELNGALQDSEDYIYVWGVKRKPSTERTCSNNSNLHVGILLYSSFKLVLLTLNVFGLCYSFHSTRHHWFLTSLFCLCKIKDPLQSCFKIYKSEIMSFNILKGQICNIQKFPFNSDTAGGKVNCSEQPAARARAPTLNMSARVSTRQWYMEQRDWLVTKFCLYDETFANWFSKMAVLMKKYVWRRCHPAYVAMMTLLSLSVTSW